MAKGWRVTETYVKCICDSITMGNNLVNVFKYHPVIGSGYIELNGNTDWGDDVIPIEYDRFKTRVELLKDLGYSVMFIATKLGTTEEEVRKIVGKDYVHKDYSEMRSEYFMLLNENGRLHDEVRDKNGELETLKKQYEMLTDHIDDCCTEASKKLSEENDSLKKDIEHTIELKNTWAEEALRYKEELAIANGKHADAMRSKNDLEYRVGALRAEARDYKKRYQVAKDANASLSDRYEKLITQRDMAIRLLFCTHDYDEIANALHIPESLVRVIICEKVVKEGTV